MEFLKEEKVRKLFPYNFCCETFFGILLFLFEIDIWNPGQYFHGKQTFLGEFNELSGNVKM